MQGTDLITYLAKSHPHVVLVGITKNRDISAIFKLLNTGISHIWESYMQEAQEKFSGLENRNCTKHLVWHLQSRKVSQAIQIFDMIQSVDSLKLLRAIDAASWKLWKVQDILLQVNLTQEVNKYGFDEASLDEAVSMARSQKNVSVRWLMCMWKHNDPDETRKVFRRLSELVDKYGLDHCSMGMSDDWEIALQEGSSILRIGRALFDD